MKLLDAIKKIQSLSIEDWCLIQNCLENRRDWLEEREPESSGSVYDNWEMKFEEWCEICEMCEDIISQLNDNVDMSDEIEEFADCILGFHYVYKGLSRLKL